MHTAVLVKINDIPGELALCDIFGKNDISYFNTDGFTTFGSGIFISNIIGSLAHTYNSQCGIDTPFL
jgi:hypothetical protein